jgi:hypothetical protein
MAIEGKDAIELHELSATLKAAFPPESSRRLVMLACDMYAMQFMEVAYELRWLLDLLVGLQPGESETAGPLLHWPYARSCSAGSGSLRRR